MGVLTRAWTRTFGQMARILRISNTKSVTLLGSLPPGHDWREFTDTLKPTDMLTERPDLRERLTKFPPRVILSIVSVGTTTGFRSADYSRSVISEDWWRGAEKSVALFAYCCWSHEFLSASHVTDRISGALCYTDQIWLWTGSQGYWASVVRGLTALVSKSGRADSRTRITLREFYDREIRRLASSVDRRHSTWADQICLVKQELNIRYIEGGGP